MHRRGFAIGRILGVEVRLDPSLLVIFLLIVVSLGVSGFRAWHPTWSTALTWSVAALAGVTFVLSILLHELAHAVVAKAYGLPVEHVTLYLFGGVADIEEEPGRPGIEAAMAVVGPLTSLAIGAFCIALGAAIAGPPVLGMPPALYAQLLGPIPTLLAWLGPVNILLGVFNLLPGFPLDGGRLLRAGLWKATGDFATATRWSARVGVAIGWVLVLAGVATALGFDVPYLGGGLLGGIWLALIGWFMTRLAVFAEGRTLVEARLDHVPVREVMARDLAPVSPTSTIAAFAHDLAEGHDQTSWPVLEGGALLGVVRVDDVQRVPHERWATTLVREIMVPADQLPVASPGQPASEALRKLSHAPADHVTVEEGGRWLGLVRPADIVRWLQLHAGDQTV